ncbi:MAG: ATP-grasp domain-containing protein [Polyangiaceae bacterium]|nr:ATP-grasp domain-containing protein [Polyangiaceae bacterium]
MARSKGSAEPGAIAIVDAYSSGAELARRLEQRGRLVVHVKSAPTITKFYLSSFAPQSFAVNLGFMGNRRELFNRLRDLEVEAVLPGAETGVELAELIAKELELPANRENAQSIRRNKFEMLQAVKAAGLHAAEQARASSIEDVEALLNGQKEWPVVVKPTSSSGGDGVRICPDRESALAAAHAILDSVNKLGLRNQDLVIESYLEGEELIIDLTRGRAQTVVHHVCRSTKKVTADGQPIFDCIELIDFESEPAVAAIAYLEKALDALGFDYGAVHAEVKMTSKGPALLEVAARLPSANLPVHFEKFVEHSALETLVDLMGTGPQFDQRAEKPAQRKGHVTAAFLALNRSGKLVREPRLSDFPRFRSRVDLVWLPKAGTELSPTKDIYTSPGMIIFQADNQNRINGDIERLREEEAASLDRLF